MFKEDGSDTANLNMKTLVSMDSGKAPNPADSWRVKNWKEHNTSAISRRYFLPIMATFAIMH
jgi:hypothetical protein